MAKKKRKKKPLKRRRQLEKFAKGRAGRPRVYCDVGNHVFIFKYCSRCERVLPYEDYYQSRRARQTYCKKCEIKRARENQIKAKKNKYKNEGVTLHQAINYPKWKRVAKKIGIEATMERLRKHTNQYYKIRRSAVRKAKKTEEAKRKRYRRYMRKYHREQAKKRRAEKREERRKERLKEEEARRRRIKRRERKRQLKADKLIVQFHEKKRKIMERLAVLYNEGEIYPVFSYCESCGADKVTLYAMPKSFSIKNIKTIAWLCLDCYTFFIEERENAIRRKAKAWKEKKNIRECE